MNRDELERELRARLEAMEAEGTFGFIVATPDEMVSALLPWIVEKIEDCEARASEGRLP